MEKTVWFRKHHDKGIFAIDTGLLFKAVGKNEGIPAEF